METRTFLVVFVRKTVRPSLKFIYFFFYFFQTLLKHTESTHPDHESLIESQKQVHEMAVKINCTERDNLELEQIESLIDGLIHLAATDRTFLRHDLVTIVSGQSMNRKERALFLFSDLLIVTSIKRKSGTIRKPST